MLMLELNGTGCILSLTLYPSSCLFSVLIQLLLVQYLFGCSRIWTFKLKNCCVSEGVCVYHICADIHLCLPYMCKQLLFCFWQARQVTWNPAGYKIYCSIVLALKTKAYLRIPVWLLPSWGASKVLVKWLVSNFKWGPSCRDSAEVSVDRRNLSFHL